MRELFPFASGVIPHSVPHREGEFERKSFSPMGTISPATPHKFVKKLPTRIRHYREVFNTNLLGLRLQSNWDVAWIWGATSRRYVNCPTVHRVKICLWQADSWTKRLRFM